MTNNINKCPICAEQIKINDKICPFCGSDISEKTNKHLLITTTIILGILYFIGIITWIYVLISHPELAGKIKNVNIKDKFNNIYLILSTGFFVTIPAYISICFKYKKKSSIILITLISVIAIFASVITYIL